MSTAFALRIANHEQIFRAPDRCLENNLTKPQAAQTYSQPGLIRINGTVISIVHISGPLSDGFLISTNSLVLQSHRKSNCPAPHVDQIKPHCRAHAGADEEISLEIKTSEHLAEE